MRTRILLIAGALLVFGAVNWQIAGKERLRAAGQVMFLDLAPRDPRSLMQGDYMALNFRLAAEIGRRTQNEPDGTRVAVVRLDAQRVATFVRLDAGSPLEPGEMRFRFRIRRGDVWLGTNAFFFQEGQAGRYAAARFGEFRVTDDGSAMLVDLRDKDLRPTTGAL